MFIIFCWLFRSLWLWECGSWQMSAKQQAFLSFLCLAFFLSFHLSTFVLFFLISIVLSFLTLLSSVYLAQAFCLLYWSVFHHINRYNSQMVWTLGPFFHDLNTRKRIDATWWKVFTCILTWTCMTTCWCVCVASSVLFASGALDESLSQWFKGIADTRK